MNLAVVEESNLKESLQPNAGEDGASLINNDEGSISELSTNLTFVFDETYSFSIVSVKCNCTSAFDHHLSVLLGQKLRHTTFNFISNHNSDASVNIERKVTD